MQHQLLQDLAFTAQYTVEYVFSCMFRTQSDGLIGRSSCRIGETKVMTSNGVMRTSVNL